MRANLAVFAPPTYPVSQGRPAYFYPGGVYEIR